MLAADAQVADAVAPRAVAPPAQAGVIGAVQRPRVFGKAERRAGFFQAHAQFDVLGLRERRVESADREVVGAIERSVAGEEQVAARFQLSGADFLGFHVEQVGVPPFEERHSRQVRIGADSTEHHRVRAAMASIVSGEEIRADLHVVVEDDDDLTARREHTGMTRCSRACIRLTEHARFRSCDSRLRVRAVVDDDDLEVPESLLLELRQQPLQELRPVVGGDDDAEPHSSAAFRSVRRHSDGAARRTAKSFHST